MNLPVYTNVVNLLNYSATIESIATESITAESTAKLSTSTVSVAVLSTALLLETQLQLAIDIVSIVAKIKAKINFFILQIVFNIFDKFK